MLLDFFITPYNSSLSIQLNRFLATSGTVSSQKWMQLLLYIIFSTAVLFHMVIKRQSPRIWMSTSKIRYFMRS